MRRRSHRQLGLSVLEVAVATVGFAVILGAVVSGTGTAVSTWEDSVSTTIHAVKASSALDAIVADLEDAAPESIADLLAPPLGSSTITFRRRTGFTAGTDTLGPEITIAWVGDPDDPIDGRDNDGDGAIDEGRVLRSVGDDRTVLADNVSRFQACESGEEVTGESRTGLAFVLKKSALKVELTLVTTTKEGDVKRKTKRATIKLGS